MYNIPNWLEFWINLEHYALYLFRRQMYTRRWFCVTNWPKFSLLYMTWWGKSPLAPGRNTKLWDGWDSLLWSLELKSSDPVPEKKTNVIFTHLSVNESLVHLCLSNLTHLTILFCPSEKEIDFFTVPLVFEERSIGVGSFVVQLWRSSSSSLTGRQEEEDSRSIPESMLPPSPLPTSTSLPPPPKPPPCRLVLAPTHRRSLVFRLDLPSPLSLSLFASRSTTVELSRVGLWVSARVNTGILEIFLGVSEAKDQVFRSSKYISANLWAQ